MFHMAALFFFFGLLGDVNPPIGYLRANTSAATDTR